MPKIMRVYYDNAGYPYKDSALSVRYPIVEGGEFTGANNTTEVHFYCENLGQATWVANCKLPNGEKVNRLLVSGVDEEGDTYQNLPLDSELTSVKGHLKIGLNGYAGNISIDEEELENNNIVVISGTPTIVATGIVDIAVNYSPIIIPVSDLTPTEYQELLALMGTKADIASTIFVATNINRLDPSSYATNQLVYDRTSKVLYRNNGDAFIVELTTEDYIKIKKISKTATLMELYNLIGTDPSFIQVSGAGVMLTKLDLPQQGHPEIGISFEAERYAGGITSGQDRYSGYDVSPDTTLASIFNTQSEYFRPYLVTNVQFDIEDNTLADVFARISNKAAIINLKGEFNACGYYLFKMEEIKISDNNKRYSFEAERIGTGNKPIDTGAEYRFVGYDLNENIFNLALCDIFDENGNYYEPYATRALSISDDLGIVSELENGTLVVGRTLSYGYTLPCGNHKNSRNAPILKDTYGVYLYKTDDLQFDTQNDGDYAEGHYISYVAYDGDLLIIHFYIEFLRNGFDITPQRIIKATENIEDGVGTNAVQEKMPDKTVNFTGRNPNAEALDSSLSTTIYTGARGNQSVAFNKNTMALGTASFTNGNKTIAKGDESHAEGYQSVSLGNGSHAEGNTTVAYGDSSHSEGLETIANYPYQHVSGKWNNNKTDTLFEVGNGASNSNRSNALEVHNDGRITIGANPTNNMDVATKQYVDSGGGTKLYRHSFYYSNENLGKYYPIKFVSTSGTQVAVGNFTALENFLHGKVDENYMLDFSTLGIYVLNSNTNRIEFIDFDYPYNGYEISGYTITEL